MPKSKEQGAIHVAILLFDRFSNLCLANAVEPLRAANGLAERQIFSWQHLGLTGDPIHSSSGLPVSPEKLDDQTGDYLLVMPSYGYRSFDTDHTRRRLRAAASRFGTLAGLDTGSWLLASAGLLDGYRATSHWDIQTSLAETFVDVDMVDQRFVIDRDRASCGGATTTLELMLELIERHQGATLALEVAAMFMFGEHDPETDLLRGAPPHQTVRAAAAVMRRNLEEPLTIAEIAGQLGLGQRALEITFKKHAGESPAKIYQSIRLSEAKRRLEKTRESISEIATRCGYSDPTAMTRAFKASFGQPPIQWRKQRQG